MCAISLQWLYSFKITGFSVFYRFFKKIPVNLILDSRPTLQAALVCAISLPYLNKITGFSRYYRFKKLPENPIFSNQKSTLCSRTSVGRRYIQLRRIWRGRNQKVRQAQICQRVRRFLKYIFYLNFIFTKTKTVNKNNWLFDLKLYFHVAISFKWFW